MPTAAKTPLAAATLVAFCALAVTKYRQSVLEAFLRAPLRALAVLDAGVSSVREHLAGELRTYAEEMSFVEPPMPKGLAAPVAPAEDAAPADDEEASAPPAALAVSADDWVRMRKAFLVQQERQRGLGAAYATTTADKPKKRALSWQRRSELAPQLCVLMGA